MYKRQVRDEVHESPESHFLTPEQAAAVAALSDEEIESWVHEVAAGDDAFWAAHDGLRSDVIARLAEVIAGREDNDGSAPSSTSWALWSRPPTAGPTS